MTVVTGQLSPVSSRLIAIMRGARRIRAVACASWAVLAVVTTASAQTLPDLPRFERLSASAVSPISVVHEYIPAAASAPGQASIPANLKISPLYRDLVNKMLSRSATFRGQVLRIATAPYLSVHLQAAPTALPREMRAKTAFARKDGRMIANIDITPLDNDVELIAHEIEHVVEQLDDIDLAAQAARPNTGVRASRTSGVFETTRATRIGQKVAQEVQ